VKKILTVILSLAIVIVLASGCAKSANNNKTSAKTQDANAKAKKETVIKVGASPVPHAQILNFVKPMLEKQGVKLEVVEMTDYVTPNEAVYDRQLDANFFQHQPYLDEFNKEKGTNLVSVTKVHIEPMGLYSKKSKNR